MKSTPSAIILIVCASLLVCCAKPGDSDALTGELYFKLISPGSFYGGETESIAAMNRYLDSLRMLPPDAVNKQDAEALAFYDGLKARGLINKPFFHIMIDSNTYIVYADTLEHSKISGFERQDLINNNKKVVIELNGEIVQAGPWNVIDCKTINRVERVPGKTHWRK